MRPNSNQPRPAADPISVLCGTHGNEPLGPAFHTYLQAHPISGVRSRIAHPEAVRTGERFLGNRNQLMRHYPGDPSGDPEDIAAYKNIQWLGSSRGNDQVMVFDVHDCLIPGSYMAVGERGLCAALTGAYLMGFDKCLAYTNPFYTAIPNAVLLETPLLKSDDQVAAIDRLHAGLNILAGLGVDALQERYDECAASITFYYQQSLLIVKSGEDEPIGFEILEELEHIPIQPPFTPLILPDAIRSALRIESDCYYGSWGHENMSPTLPEFGLTGAGKPRRLAFGDIAQKIQPPIRDGAWVTFDASALTLA